MSMYGRNQHNIIVILQLQINKKEKGRKKYQGVEPKNWENRFLFVEKWNVEEKEKV